jgi:hypothetical protein
MPAVSHAGWWGGRARNQESIPVSQKAGRYNTTFVEKPPVYRRTLSWARWACRVTLSGYHFFMSGSGQAKQSPTCRAWLRKGDGGMAVGALPSGSGVFSPARGKASGPPAECAGKSPSTEKVRWNGGAFATFEFAGAFLPNASKEAAVRTAIGLLLVAMAILVAAARASAIQRAEPNRRRNQERSQHTQLPQFYPARVTPLPVA